MAIGGIQVESGTNGLCEFTTEWSVEPAYKSLKFTFKLYFEASKATRISKASKGSGVIEFCGMRNIFATPEFSSTEKQLLTTQTFNVLVDKVKNYNFNCFITFGVPKIKLYTGLISYVETTGTETDQISVNKFKNIVKSSSVSFPNEGILGTDSTITVTKPYDEYSHSIAWSCGSESGNLCENSDTANITANFPLDLSAQNPTGDSVDILFNVTTYYDDVVIDETTYTGTYTIPDSVIPSCTVKVTEGAYKDNQPIADIYGGYVQRQSMLNIVVNPTEAYGSPIVSYKIMANGSEYDEAEVTTGVIVDSGTQSVTVTVTDERGRTSELVTETIDVIPYSVPVVTRVKINRCDKDGIEQATGNDHIKVTFDAEISPVNNENSASYMLRYQKTSGFDQADIYLTDFDGQYSVTGGEYVFEADVMSPYTVTIYAIDDFDEGRRTTGGSTASTLLNILASGLGLCFGAVARIENAVENTFLTYPSGGFMFPKLTSEDSLYHIETPNVYTCVNGNDISGSPTSNPFTLIVLPCGDNEILYIIIDSEVNVFIRILKDSSFSQWKTFTLTDV